MGFQRAALIASSAYIFALVVLAITLPHVRPTPRANARALAGLAVAPSVAEVVWLRNGDALRYSSNLRWLLYLDGVTRMVYPG